MIEDIISVAVKAYPDVMQFLTGRAHILARKAAHISYESVRGEYWATIYDAVQDYLESDSPITRFRYSIIRGMTNAFNSAAEIGYEDGGSELPFDEDTLAWIDKKIAAEQIFIDSLFQDLKQNWESKDIIHEANARADGYTSTLDQIYSEAKVLGSKNKMLTFVGDDGAESCTTCKQMKGQRHKASWWMKYDLCPGSDKYECGGWRCQHYLEDDNGNQVTL